MSIQTQPRFQNVHIARPDAPRLQITATARAQFGRRVVLVLAIVVLEAIVVLAAVGMSAGIGGEPWAPAGSGAEPFMTPAPEAAPTP